MTNRQISLSSQAVAVKYNPIAISRISLNSLFRLRDLNECSLEDKENNRLSERCSLVVHCTTESSLLFNAKVIPVNVNLCNPISTWNFSTYKAFEISLFLPAFNLLNPFPWWFVLWINPSETVRVLEVVKGKDLRITLISILHRCWGQFFGVLNRDRFTVLRHDLTDLWLSAGKYTFPIFFS